MADWWDQLGTNIGNALIAPQTFGGLMPMPTDPAQRQAMIGPALLSLGAGLFQGARQGQGPMEAFASAYGGLQQQGAQQGAQRLQGMLLGSKLQEQQKRNQTRETLKKMAPPEGYTPETWGAFVDAADAKDLLGIYQQSIQRQRDRAAIGSMGGFPGMGGPSGAPSGDGSAPPSGGVFDVPQQFAPQVRAASDKYGVPLPLLASTFYNESRWNPNAVNPNDQGPGIPSLGLGQWGKQWAEARGFDPMNPDQSIEHTAQAMSEYARKYGGNFLLARLAYGWGPGNVDKWLAAGGDPDKIPDGAKVWLPRTAFGIADDKQARAAFPQVAGLLRPGPVQMPWDRGQMPNARTAEVTQGNPVTPVQYTPGQPQGQPAPQIDYQSDPIMQDAFRQFQAAKQRGDLKAAEEAMRRGAERRAELQKQSEARTGQVVELEDGKWLVDPRTGEKIKRIGDRPVPRGESREFSQEDQLRAQYIAQNKEFGAVRSSYGRIVAAAQEGSKGKPTAAGDIALIYGYMKMLDPTGAVREGDYATASNAGGVPERIRILYNKAVDGELLTPDMRADFVDRAGKLYSRAFGEYSASRKVFQKLAEDYGLNPGRVAPDLAYGVEDPSVPKPPGEIKKGTRYRNPQTGQEVLWDGQQWIDVKTLKPVTSGRSQPEPMPTR